MLGKKEYIYEVYKTGSFSKAAKNLYISQPALSAAVVKTESELGMQLFNRSTHPVTLTEAGRAYIEAVEGINSIEYDFQNKLSEIANMQVGHLTVACANFFSSCMLPPIIKHFSRSYPAITFEIVESDSIELYDMALEKHIDLILDAGVYNHDLFQSHHILTEQILLAVPKDYAINESYRDYQYTYADILNNRHKNNDQFIPISAFKNNQFILLKKGHDMHARSIHICQQHGFEPARALYLNQLMTAYNLSAQDLGIVFVTDTLVKLAPEQNSLIYYAVNGRSAYRDIFLAHRKKAILTKAMKYFIASARDVFH